MKKGWQTKPLGEVCQINPPKSEARRLLAATDLVSFVPMEYLGIDQKILIHTQEKPLSDVAGSYTYFADGDVLLAKITPCFENGKLGIAANLTNGIGFGSSEYIVFRSDQSIDKEWLYYFLSRESFRTEGAARMSGAVGHKRVSKEFIETYPIRIPPRPEQRRIIGIIDEVFDSIATAKANAERNLQNARALFESHLQSVFTQRGEGWVEKTLSEVCTDIFAGGDVPKDNCSKEATDKHQIPIYTNGEKNKGLYGYTSVARVTSPSITISARGTIGYAEIRNESFYPAIRLIVVVPKSDALDIAFLYYAIQSIDIGHSGTSIPQLTVPMVRGFSIPIPQLKAYHHFSDPEWDGEPLEPEPCPKCGCQPCECEKRPPQPCLVCGQRPCVCEKPPCPKCGQRPCKCKKKAKIKLADGKERNIQHMMMTSFWHPDGTPMSAQQFMELLFGKLPDFFKDEAELRALWSAPDTRAKLLQGLADKGFGHDQLAEMQKIIDAEKSDIFDVLAHVAYGLQPLTREERAAKARVIITQRFNSRQQVFLNFVLAHYVTIGVEELDQTKLTPLLRLQYHDSIADAVADLGRPEEIGQVFAGFQKYLYQPQVVA